MSVGTAASALAAGRAVADATVGDTLVSFWDGPVSWMERLCLAAALATGHRVRIYTYSPVELARALPGVEIVDAEQVVARDSEAFRRVLPVARAYFADIFRLKLMVMGAGVWIDLDVLMLAPMASLSVPASGYIYGLERPDLIGNSVLYLPARSAMLEEALRLSTSFAWTAPWWPWHKKLRRSLSASVEHCGARLAGRPAPVFKKTFMGPHVLTYLARRMGLIERAQPPCVFYPVPQTEFRRYMGPVDEVERSIVAGRTVAVHLCHGSFRDVGWPQPTGWLAAMCEKHGVDGVA